MSMSFVVIDVKPGEQICIGGHLVTIELLRKTGQLARLRVGAPPQVPIKRTPIDDKTETQITAYG
jgi:sRNA-binding carbon storage regulator CsrA